MPATILHVEDDPLVRETICEMLSEGGYVCVSAAHGREAQELFDARSHQFDLLISDMLMPGGLDGLRVAALFKEHFPGKPVIIMSGYMEDKVVTAAAASGIAVIGKPTLMAMFLQAVAAALANRSIADAEEVRDSAGA